MSQRRSSDRGLRIERIQGIHLFRTGEKNHENDI